MIVDYASLQSNISEWLARGDLTPAIPTFIQLAEGRINRELFVRQRMFELSGTASLGEIETPEDLYRVHTLNDQNTYPTPLSYSVVNNLIQLDGTQNRPFRLTYWAKIPPLSDSNPQNWLLADQPGIYLYGALIEAAPFIRDDPRLPVWGSQYQTIVDRMGINDDYARYGSGVAQVIPNAP